MQILIDIDDPSPLFAQIVGQIKGAVLCDKIVAGDALPSIRQLARDLRLNNKTIAKAYRLLERDNVIESKGYRGTFVHPDAKANSKVDLTSWVLAQFTQTVETCRKAGITDSEIRIAFADVMHK
jgi:GntR family transcriptional regulator